MPTAPALPAGSTLGHSYEYGLDINLGTHDVPDWKRARRISGFQPTPTPATQNVQSYDDFGVDNADVTGWNTNLAFGIQVNRSTSTGKYLEEVEALLLRTRPSAKGASAVIEVRWYHKPESGTPNPDDAGQGYFTVTPQRANVGADGAIEMLNFTLTGKGTSTEIANPFTGWDAAAPTITASTPAAAGTGELVTFTGTGFVGTTDVTVDATVSEFTVVGDLTIVVALEAGTAGDVDVIVTNATGVSAAYSYTRGA